MGEDEEKWSDDLSEIRSFQHIDWRSKGPDGNHDPSKTLSVVCEVRF